MKRCNTGGSSECGTWISLETVQKAWDSCSHYSLLCSCPIPLRPRIRLFVSLLKSSVVKMSLDVIWEASCPPLVPLPCWVMGQIWMDEWLWLLLKTQSKFYCQCLRWFEPLAPHFRQILCIFFSVPFLRAGLTGRELWEGTVSMLSLKNLPSVFHSLLCVNYVLKRQSSKQLNISNQNPKRSTRQ